MPLDTSEQDVPSHVMTAVHRSTLGCTKLRDSCYLCATSKIKCPKEKPSCSKCEARNIRCQYFFAKRPGRRRENSTGHPNSCTSRNNNNTNFNSSNPNSNSKSNTDKKSQSVRSRYGDTINAVGLSPQAGYATNGTVPPTSLRGNDSFLDTPPSMTIATSLMPDNVPGTYSSDVFSVLGDSNIFPQLVDWDPDINDMDFLMTDYFENPVMDSNSVTDTLNNIGSLPMPDESINFDLVSSDANDLMTASFAVPSLAPSVQTPSTANSSAMRSTTTDSSCGCATQALDLLKTLSSAQSSVISTFAGTDLALSSDMANMGFAHTVLLENKQIMETVSRMLSCSSCTEDAFLLAILSMIVLKILERYATAARTQIHGSRAGSVESDTVPRLANSIISSSKDHMMALSSTYNMPRDDSASGQVPARLVLSELHRVQRLVNHLSTKLKGPKQGDGRGMEHAFWARPKVAEENDKPIATPFSSNTLAHMESDLRESLSFLSADIINRLQQN
ncbi:C6 zinc finger domain protein [Aspergillus cavernicola]|uniref:C6 zinc finger domain protein n=1 Tax=Aspergillus cavernicola TaxID=176166 RepID=A0ABR4IVA4_9EURO